MKESINTHTIFALIIEFLGIVLIYVEFQIYADPFIWSLIIFMAVISTGSQWFLTRAYSLCRASIIGVVSYTNIPFAIGFGVMLGDSLPDLYTFAGITLIVLGGILVGKKSSNKT